MAEKYNAITEMLKKEDYLFLQIHHYKQSGGLTNARYAAIFEPNPHKGKVANPCSGMDQQFLHGEYWERRGFEFAAKNTLEGLSLLERAAKGEKHIQNTVIEGRGYVNQLPAIHGNPQSQGGLDSWVTDGYKFIVQETPEGLKANIICYFFETDNIVISSKKVKSVDEGVEFYESHPVSQQTIHHIRRGLLLDDRIQNCSDFINPKPNLLAEQGFKIVQTEFMQNYLAALDELRPFNLSNQCKNGLFMSMILSNFYKTDKKKEID